MKLSLFVQPAHRAGHPSLAEELASRRVVSAPMPHPGEDRPWNCRCALIAVNAARAVVVNGESAEYDAHATAIEAGQVPEWVHLLPLGSFSGRDGRGPWNLKDATKVIETSKSYHTGQPIPMDFDHQLEFTEENGGGAPASGWITELAARADGLWGKVDWTPDGAKALSDRKYRFLSPVFAFAKSGEVLAVLRAGLTNKPNLALTAINAAASTSGEESQMSDKLLAGVQRLAALFGLPATADVDAVFAAANSVVESERVTRGQLTMLRTRTNLGDSATAEQIFTAVQSQVTIDPSKYVAMSQYTQVTDELKTLRVKDTERVVGAAIAEGKLLPAQREWAIAYHSQDAAGFEAFIGKQPKIVEPGKEEVKGSPAAGDKKIDDAGKAVCSQLGISEEQFLGTSTSK